MSRRDEDLRVESAIDAERFIEDVGSANTLTDARRAGPWRRGWTCPGPRRLWFGSSGCSFYVRELRKVLHENEASQPDFAVFLNVFAFLRFVLSSPHVVLSSPHVVLSSPHAVLASLHAVLESSRIVFESLRVAVASPGFVLAFPQIVAPLLSVAMVFRHVVATPLEVVLASMQIDSAESRGRPSH
jgi:hypothetical protein